MASSLRLVLVAVGLFGCTQLNPAFDEHDTVIGGESLGSDEVTSEESGSSEVGTSESTSAETTTETTDTGETDTGTDTGEPACEAPLAYVDCDGGDNGIAQQPWLALGLNCPGGADETIPADATFSAVDTASWRIAKSFGLASGPNYGGKLWSARDQDVISGGDGQPDVPPNTSSAILIMSTGTLPQVNANGAVLLPVGAQEDVFENFNPDAPTYPLPPEPISPELGSNGGQGGAPFVNCAIGRDCSDTLYEPWVVHDYDFFHDKIWMSFTVTPPAGVHGFVFDLAFFTAEYPLYVDLPEYADTFVAWASSDTFTGNLTFLAGEPLSPPALDKSGGFAHTGLDPALAGTGFEYHAGTNWMRVYGPATPLEPLEVTFFLTDLGDAQRASVVLLDNFRWHCGGCDPDTCGPGG